MILIGQYDSPFVRRVAVAMRLYGIGYDHRPWSVFGDAERIAVYNPLLRVPTLVLDDGEVLIDSAAILDHLDQTAGPDQLLIPRFGPQRRRALKLCALATGAADKAVALIYDRVLHENPSAFLADRVASQIAAALTALETDRAAHATEFWFGARIGHADIAAACAIRFIAEAHPALFDPLRWPALAAHAAVCEALPAFQAATQPFIPPR